ncbi:MAG: hypothetical protein WC707_07015 [Candidatus Babeliaceae bacterium]|jgi:hypothetical protein
MNKILSFFQDPNALITSGSGTAGGLFAAIRNNYFTNINTKVVCSISLTAIVDIIVCSAISAVTGLFIKLIFDIIKGKFKKEK